MSALLNAVAASEGFLGISKYASVPQPLRDVRNWVIWKIEPNKKTGKPDKIPYDAKTGKKAASNRPETWCDFDTAVRAADEIGSEYEGPGFELGDSEFSGFDFDGVLVDGQVEPYVVEILRLLGNPDAEVSPSGTGVKAFVKGKLPKGQTCSLFKTGTHYGVEIYSTDRYFTVTGVHHSGSDIPVLEDWTLPHFLCSQILDKEFKHLWVYGDEGKPHYGDDRSASGGDFQLVLKLMKAIPTKDPAVLDKYFRTSLRVRDAARKEKWDRLGAQTIANALKGAVTPDSTHETHPAPEPVERTAADVVTKRVEWLWKDRIPLGKITLFAGNPNNGKSLASTWLAATCTIGGEFPDGVPNTIPPSDVLMLIGEDDIDDTVVPRLKAANADLRQIHFLEGVTAPNGIQDIALDQHRNVLEEMIRRHPAIKLIIIDPISNYLGKANMMADQETRSAVLTPLKQLSAQYGIATVLIMHLNKKTEQDAINRVGGAMAFVGVSRAGWLFQRDRDEDGKLKDTSSMVPLKGNLTRQDISGLVYKTRVTNQTFADGSTDDVPYIYWTGGTTTVSADETLGSNRHPGGRPEGTGAKTPEAAQYLTDTLRDGRKLVKVILNPAKLESLGFSKRTVQRAATFLESKHELRKIDESPNHFWELVPMQAVMTPDDPQGEMAETWMAEGVAVG